MDGGRWTVESGRGIGTDGVHMGEDKVDPATASMGRRRGRSELEHRRTNGRSTSDNLAATQRTKEEGQCSPG